MSTATAYDAIKARLVDQLGATYPIRDFEEIEVSLQQGTAPFIGLDDGSGTDTLLSIGAPSQNWVEDNGFIDVHIFVPSSGGLAPARTIAAQVRTVMRYHLFENALPIGEFMRVDGVSPPMPAQMHTGLWHSLQLTITYRHQYVAATAAE